MITHGIKRREPKWKWSRGKVNEWKLKNDREFKKCIEKKMFVRQNQKIDYER